ncbi:MAG: crotonase [Gammaproteobacteria bacterium]|nr:crotonase [Gammaproteobacteria bacterium]
MSQTYQHWKIETDPTGIAWLHLDKADSNTNVLSADILNEFSAVLDELEKNVPRAVVILSNKENGFIAGADVKEFTSFESEDVALQAIRRAHTIFNRLEALSCPTIALIHGFCLGGGMELALACRYRIADNDPKTKLGLPEVRLGIHPGFGGTLRAIRLVGVLSAMDMMLTGRNLSARAAQKIGLVNYAVPKRHLLNAARGIVKQPPHTMVLPWWKRLASHKRVRPLLAKIFYKKVAAKAPRSHYPAPYSLIDLWVQHYDNPTQMLDYEAQSVAHLISGRTAQNLIRVFLLQEQLKGLGKADDFQATHVHVIGAGVMGGDIAAWCALRGFRVTLQDQKHEALANVIKRAYKLYQKRLKHRLAITDVMDRLIPDPKGNGLSRADVIIEAIFEDVEVKRNLFKSIEPQVKPTALLATNTSSIPLDVISNVMQQPSRLVGLHFFNPVAMMPLVEIVQSPTTDSTVATAAAAFTRKIDRLPLPVTSTPGFLVNRILMPYLMEAVVLAQEGIPLKVIDDAATDFGMPMGPIELADTVGLDICLHVAKNLAQHMSIEVPEQLQKMVDKGQLGKKSGQGFYRFKDGKPQKEMPPKSYTPPVDIQDRLILRLLNEAVACLRDGVVTSEDLADGGIIFGTGFAPFRGGPFHYIHYRGAAQLLKMLEHLQHRYGPRFTADAGWQQLDNNTTA